MTNPYQSPRPNSTHSEEFIKLVGIEIRKRNYILIQTCLICLLVILGAVLLAINGQVFGINLNYFGTGCFIIAVLEVVETFYATKFKSYSK